MKAGNKEIRVTAKTLENALSEAAEMLNVPVGQVEHRVVSQTNGGFFSFLGKKVEISAWKKGVTKPNRRTERLISEDEADEARHHDGPGEDRPELTAAELKTLVEDLRVFCEGICGYLSESKPKVEAELEEGRLILNIDDESLANLFIKNSKLAESLEHILRKKPRHLKRELPFRIFIDVKGVRLNREKDLIELAKDLSEKVHENKRPIVLNYKSSYDRKIIHMALDKDDRVYTKSIGSGPNRKLMILPIRKGEEEAPEAYS